MLAISGVAALGALLVGASHEPVVQAQGQVTPVIAGVAGTLTNGSLVTISGTQLNAERKAGWDSFFVNHPNAWSFEGTDFRADGYTQPGGDPGGVYDSSVRILGNKSVKFRSTVTNPNCATAGIGYSSLIVPNTLSSDVWLRVYVRYNRISNFPSNYTKMLYALGAGYYFQPAGVSAGANPTSMNATYDGTSHPIPVPSGSLANGRWFAVELHWKPTPPKAYEVYWDGVLVHSGQPTDARSDLGSILFGIVNACGTTSWDIENWMDGLALATSRIYPSAIVEVGNNPNYSSAQRNIQELTTISDSQVVFRLNTSGLGAGPFYVWVRNNTQATSVAFPLAGGTTLPVPAAPTNVRVIR
jgi:hypothetical protein